jgi:hypothetical protein
VPERFATVSAEQLSAHTSNSHSEFLEHEYGPSTNSMDEPSLVARSSAPGTVAPLNPIQYVLNVLLPGFIVISSTF